MGDIFISRLGEHGEQAPYFPFHIAVEKGILNPGQARPSDDVPGVTLASGRIPNSKQAGVVSMGVDRVAAFDHAAGEFRGKSLEIAPSPKTAVSREGQVQDEGVIIVGDEAGRLKIAAFAIDVVRQPWVAEDLARRTRFRSLGRVAVFLAPVLDMPEYEIADVDTGSGLITAKPRHHYF